MSVVILQQMNIKGNNAYKIEKNTSGRYVFCGLSTFVKQLIIYSSQSLLLSLLPQKFPPYVSHLAIKPLNFYLLLKAPFQSLPMVILSVVWYLSEAVVPILNSAFLLGIFFSASYWKPSFGLGSLNDFKYWLLKWDCKGAIHPGVRSLQMHPMQPGVLNLRSSIIKL